MISQLVRENFPRWSRLLEVTYYDLVYQVMSTVITLCSSWIARWSPEARQMCEFRSIVLNLLPPNTFNAV